MFWPSEQPFPSLPLIDCLTLSAFQKRFKAPQNNLHVYNKILEKNIKNTRVGESKKSKYEV